MDFFFQLNLSKHIIERLLIEIETCLEMSLSGITWIFSKFHPLSSPL